MTSILMIWSVARKKRSPHLTLSGPFISFTKQFSMRDGGHNRFLGNDCPVGVLFDHEETCPLGLQLNAGLTDTSNPLDGESVGEVSGPTVSFLNMRGPRV